jgi:hypothetical protein
MGLSVIGAGHRRAKAQRTKSHAAGTRRAGLSWHSVQIATSERVKELR